MSLRDAIATHLPDLRAIRHDLHAHPELAYNEHRTCATIAAELARLNIAHISHLAPGPNSTRGTGVVAHLPATAPTAPGTRAVGLRADIDALPILERTGAPYASTTPGLMHACGHDGHTTMLLGAARILRDIPRPKPITLVFQPAEEGGGGADRLCSLGLMEGKVLGPPIERMYGLHAWPDLPLGTIGTRAGPLLASTDEFEVDLVGRQAHAAYPHESHDPIVAMAACISALQTVVSRTVAPTDAAVVSVCQVRGGTAINVIPERVFFQGTLRTLRAATRAACRERIIDTISGIASAHRCTAEVRWHEGYPVTVNDETLTREFLDRARSTLGPERVVEVPSPTLGGEDFAYYAQRAPSVFFFLGLRPPTSTTYPTLHQPDFDFNDDAMATGVEMLCTAALA